MADSNDAPRVSVVMSTYNHEEFIAQAIEGVLVQDISLELLINDDVSTDATSSIVDEFAARHPSKIRVRRPPANTNSNRLSREAFAEARGEFIAIMDGDDYWIDTGKLRRQAAYLDANPDCAMCFHDCIVVDERNRVLGERFGELPPPAKSDFRDIAKGCFVPGPTPLLRRSALADLDERFDHQGWGDWPLFLLAAQHGKLGYIPEKMAAYRIHGGGWWSGKSHEDRFRMTYEFIRDFGQVLPPERRNQLAMGIGQAWGLGVCDAIAARRWRSLLSLIRDLLTIGPHSRRPSLLINAAIGTARVLRYRISRWAREREADERRGVFRNG